MDGVWVVFAYDVNAYPVAVFAQEDEVQALRVSNDLSYTYVKFWRFNELWEHLHRKKP